MQRGLLLAALTRKPPLFALRRSLAVARATIVEGVSCHPAKAPENAGTSGKRLPRQLRVKGGEDSVELVFILSANIVRRSAF